MSIAKFTCAFLVSLLPALQATAQQSQPIQLQVVVDTKSGQPVTSLRQQDFTILDNKSPRPISNFKVVTAAQPPVDVILFLDAVNTPLDAVAYMRDETDKFLKANEGALAHPTAIAILTDQGVHLTSGGFSTDGNSLSDVLKNNATGLRSVTRNSQWSGIDRFNISLNALHQIVTAAATLPGHKIILWISPGWPLLSGARIDLTAKQEQYIFSQAVNFSTQLRQSDITLYDINPYGVSQSLMNANYYQSFLKGLAKPNDAQFGNLGLQVLAVQSGGLALESNSDVTGNIQKCLVDANSWYEITFDPPPADKPNEYHHIEVRLGQPGLVARTRDGYYSNPVAVEPAH